MSCVQAIDEHSPHLDAVRQLWRVHSATLGFLPDGAFLDYARQRRVVVALNDKGACVGYLLYRMVRDHATIAHFCVAAEYRRQGVAKAMMAWLVAATKSCAGITLGCRSDFEASRTWPRLGFQPVGTRKGRAGEITVWWQGHGNPDLFTGDGDGTLTVAIDANVFFDLLEDRNEETRGLQADWLRPFVTLYYTSELLVELNRSQGQGTRRSSSTDLASYPMLDCSTEGFQNAEARLRPLFPTMNCERDESDYRHLVRAFGAGANIFVTRDSALLDMADDVFQQCGLAIVRPSELITQIDVLQQEHLYQRTQVAGTNCVFNARVQTVDRILDAVRFPHERQGELSRRLNQYLADPKQFACHEICDQKGKVLAAFVLATQGSEYHVPFLRIADRRRANTLVRTILSGIITEASRVGRSAVLVTEVSIDPVAAADLGFLRLDVGYLKLVVRGCHAIDSVVALIDRAESEIDLIIADLPNARGCNDKAARVEHLLWPAKLIDSNLPCFIVPIRPRFAEHLFDNRLAGASLFGVDPELALNTEAAYYRASRPAVVKAPARVLWYVSQNKAYEMTQCIRACSRVVEVCIGTPKELFRRFRRLGVYAWADVFETARKSLERQIMAFRFDDTELLPPLTRARFQPILRAHGIRNNIQGPIAVPSEAFAAVYSAAFDSPAPR